MRMPEEEVYITTVVVKRPVRGASIDPELWTHAMLEALAVSGPARQPQGDSLWQSGPAGSRYAGVPVTARGGGPAPQRMERARWAYFLLGVLCLAGGGFFFYLAIRPPH